ncbi:MAG: hypothetical protein AVDCRST_MAG77-2683, partial [uncultured Chloroflexi bacterium]
EPDHHRSGRTVEVRPLPAVHRLPRQRPRRRPVLVRPLRAAAGRCPQRRGRGL